jgi:hypothetical protein
MSERKPSKIDKVKWALYRTATEVKPEKLATTKWVVYGAVALSTVLLFACEGGGHTPKYPRAAGD